MAFSMFSTPQPQQPQSLFQPQQQPQNPFQQSSPLFAQQQPQQSLFSQPQQPSLFQQQPPQLPTQAQQQQMFLFTQEKAPASYGTEWADLHPDSQKILLQIEERILEYRDESQRLDQCSRLYDSSVSNEGFELDASHIFQELGGISTAMERQKPLLVELMAVVKDMLRNTEVAVRSFMMLRSRFIHAKTGGASNGTLPPQGPGATLPQGSSSQQTTTSIVPAYDFYQGLPKKPSPFLQQTVSRFQKYLTECRQWVEELEQLLLSDSERSSSSNGAYLLHSLPKVISNIHDFFVHVAAKVESIHQNIESMKTAYLADQRRRGEINDPFLEADRRETAKQEAAAKRVHPTLHLPASSQPSTQVAGLFATSATPAAASVPQTSAASSGSAVSLFSTPSSSAASSMSSPLFTTPASGASAQTSLFSSSSGSLFASASTPSLFASSAPSLAPFASTGGSLFPTPFASGAATGSGASFGAPSRSSRPKSRSTRR